MKTGILRKGISMMAVAAMTMALLIGCGERANVPVNPFTKERDILDFDAIYTMNETSGSGTLATYAGNLFTPAKREALYNSKNGWSVKYDPEMFMLYEDGPVVNFVYMGESAGTNMITVTYTTEKNAQKAINDIGKPYGKEAYYTQGIFPGTEDEKGYYVNTAPDTKGSGSYMSAAARDYKDGALVFEVCGHMGEDEFNNMEVSDALAGIIDSVQFSK